MEPVLLVIHLMLALAIIGLVLIQRSEGGGLGIGGGGGGMGGLATAKGTANALTRATSICAAAFFCTSLALGILAGKTSSSRVLDVITEAPAESMVTPVEAPIDAEDFPVGGNEAAQDIPTAPIAE